MNSHPGNQVINDYVDGALVADRRAEVEQHLRTCADCALIAAELQHLIGEAACLPSIDPPPHAWIRLQSRLDQSTVAEPPIVSSASVRTLSGSTLSGRTLAGRTLTGRTLTGWTWRPVWVLATAALVVLAFLTGRVIERRAGVRQASAALKTVQPADTAANVRERVLLVAVGDHLERSQMVLVELANAQTVDELDISAERQSADELLASNRLYRQTAVQMGQTSVASVLDDLERVLVEVARGPSEISMQQLAELQRRIEAQGLLFKVKIIGSEMRQQGKPIS
jgi:anti-sigma factor RsiW